MGRPGWSATVPRSSAHAPCREFFLQPGVEPVKRILLRLGIAFVAYTVIVAPATAAQAVTQAFGGLASAGQSLGDFFDALIS
jgi:hypothetical protein